MNYTNVVEEPILYDIFNDDCHEDILMYRNMCKEFNNIMEFGIGTGRIAIPLALDGKQIIGIDKSKKMIERLTDKLKKNNVSEKIEIINQDFRFLDINKNVDCAIIGFCTFNYLLTIEDQLLALRAINSCLNNNATIIFDIFVKSTFKELFSCNEKIYIRKTKFDNQDVKIYRKTDFEQNGQLIHQKRYFEFYDNEGQLVKERKVLMTNRFFFFGEFELLMKMSGYKIVNIYGNYNLNSFDNNSNEMIVVATKCDR